MTSGRLIVVMGIAAFWGAATVRADEPLSSPRTLCPERAIVYMQTAPLQDVKRDIEAFGRAALGETYAMLGMQIEAQIASPAGRAIDMTRPAGFALMLPDLAEGESFDNIEPIPLVFLPVTDFEAFRTAMQEMEPTTQLAFRNGYALASEEGSALDLAAASTPPALSGEGDIRISLDVAGLRERFGDRVLGEIEEKLGSMEGTLPANQAAFTDIGLDVIRTCIEQIDRIQISADFSAESARVATRIVPTEGSPLERMCWNQPTDLGDLRGIIPGNAIVAVLANFRYDEIRGPLARLQAAAQEAAGAGGMDAEAWENYFGLFAGPAAYAMTPGDGFAVSGAFRTRRPVTVDDLRVLVTEVAGGGIEGGIPATQELHEGVFEHGGIPVHEMRTTFDLSNVDPTQAEMLRTMYGGETVSAYWGAKGETCGFAMGPDAREQIGTVLDNLPSGANGGMPGWSTDILRMIPAGSNGYAGADLIGLAILSGEMIGGAMGGNPFAVIEGAGLGAAPVAFYNRFDQGEGEFGLVLPAATIQTGQRAWMAIMMGMMGGGGR